jgi:hypothetical protein
MKRALLFLSASLVAIAIGAASPARADVIPCSSNISDGSAAYIPSTSTLFGTMTMGSPDGLDLFPTCTDVWYSAIISYTSHGRHVVRVAPQRGDGTPFIFFSFSRATSDNGAFCVVLLSSKGLTVLDTAPSTASLTAAPVPVANRSSPNGFSCSSGWVAVDASGSSGGGASGFAG